ncbi:hypothetical protein [Paraurantiacibacter namhicola]|uniref:Uncharacterized protein n=1 Tax=Paraurantiacibacter namhicola TaxID=645517 RepID=A0A1C7DAB4_9SPHN|nr:hypothetical protein [Paraurantiacibacter namhicola]ANU08367.1 hypothetical protein A6F65_02080 [Paraurantiacibacter namhicola]
MKKLILVATLAAMATAPAQAAIPEDVETTKDIMTICSAGTDLILAGGDTDAELAFYRKELAKRGWTDAADYNDLLRYCIMYKGGYIKRMDEQKAQ